LILAVTASVGRAADIELISQGREVVLTEHLVPGKLVLFDFYADWCAPCKIIEPHIDRLAELHPDRLAVRKIDVIDWSSPVNRQYGIVSLPHLKLFGPRGDLLAEGDANRVLEELGARLGGDSSVMLVPRSGPSASLVWTVLAALVLIAVVLVRRRRAPEVVATGYAQGSRSGVGPDAADASRIWFAVIQGSLEGPFLVGELAELRRRKQLEDNARVRRRGDAAWRTLRDVIEEEQ
jgi:thiol-disulfide isomerase/thioredoxin